MYELILENVEEKNPKDSNSVTPLHLAAQMGHFEMCKLIIENVLERNPKNSNGNTPLHYAAQGGHLEVCQLIMKNLKKRPKVQRPTAKVLGHFSHSVLAKGPRSNLTKLQERDPNPRNFEGNTPLHLALQNGDFDLCKLILKNAYDKNPIGSNGMSLLHTAAQKGQYENFKFFFEHIKENPKDSNDVTPLHLAALNGHFEICKLIIENIQDESHDQKNPKGVAHLRNQQCSLL